MRALIARLHLALARRVPAPPPEPSADLLITRARLDAALGTIDRLLSTEEDRRVHDVLLDVRHQLTPTGSSLIRPVMAGDRS